MRGELWTEVRDFPNYMISNHGRVYSVKSNVTLRSRPSGWGYLQVMLSDGHNHQTTKSIHIMVAESFVPGWAEGLEPNHKDGNKENNHESNLEWATKRQNNVHALDSGLRKPRGTKVAVYGSDLRFDTVKECAEYFDTYSTTISAVLNGRLETWKGLKFIYDD